MQDRLYRIEELEETTGVSVRNIRYYTAEGLLPPPDARGRFALYSEDHVRRLRLIRQLKEAFLPLEVIKARLQELTDPQVTAALSERPASPDAPAPGSAAAYIARVMAKRATTAAAPPPPMAAPAPAAPMPRRGRRVSTDAEEVAGSEDAAAPEVWHRIPLAPGVELHVRRVDVPVRQLIAYARTLFRPGS